MKKAIVRRIVMTLLVLCAATVAVIPVLAKTPSTTLVINGFDVREVISYTYTFTSATDGDGELVGVPRGGMITVEVKACDDGNCDLIAWTLERNNPRDGEIIVADSATKTVVKKIEFKNAYCVDFKEGMTEDGTHTEIVTISCGTLANGDAVFESFWGGSTGSMLSEGSLWIIIGAVALVVCVAAVLLIAKLKKKPAAADGADGTDEE